MYLSMPGKYRDGSAMKLAYYSAGTLSSRPQDAVEPRPEWRDLVGQRRATGYCIVPQQRDEISPLNDWTKRNPDPESLPPNNGS